MMAVANGHTDTVLYLIANGAIVNAKDSQGRTSLHRGVSPTGVKFWFIGEGEFGSQDGQRWFWDHIINQIY